RSVVRAARIAGVRRLTEVVSELGQRDPLDALDLGERRGVVVGRARLYKQESFVLLVARVTGGAGRVGKGAGGSCAGVGRDFGSRRAADALEPLRLNQERLCGIELSPLDLNLRLRGRDLHPASD